MVGLIIRAQNRTLPHFMTQCTIIELNELALQAYFEHIVAPPHL